MRLRSYLVFMAIAVLAPIVISSVAALKMLRDTGHLARLEALQSTARNISLVVDRELASSEAALYVLADSQYLKSGDLKEFYERAASVDRNKDGWTVLLDENGQQLINRGVPYGTPLPSPVAKARVDQVLRTGKTLISDVILGPVTKRLVTTVNVPVYMPDGRKYVLVKAFNTDFFNRLILSANSDPALLVGLLDSKGNFIARSLNREDLIGKPARPELIEASQKNESGYLRHLTLEGNDVYDGYTRSSLSGWTVAVAAPASQIDRSARHAALIAIAGMLGALACAAVAALLIGGRLFNAIQQAADAAVQLGKGLPPNIGESRIVEIRKLQHALSNADRQLTLARESQAKAELARQALLVSEQNARKDAESQNQAKDQFLAMLGHELRNPLAPISVASELLSRGNLSVKQLEQISDIISRQTVHMVHLVNELLDVSRISRGLVKIRPVPVDITSVIDAAIEQTKPMFTQKDHRLAVLNEAKGSDVLGDQVRLVQIMANVLSNAAKYTDPRGLIEVDVIREDAWIKITVRDSGIGIDDKLLERIFEPFSQSEQAADRSQGGLGLGLALVKGLVELHGGRIEASSGGPGQGSVFTIHLPLADRATYPVALNEDHEDWALPEKTPHKIAVVDDNFDAATTLAFFMKEVLGYTVSVYHNASTALEGIAIEQPDVFILDIGLPDMDGYDLAKAILSRVSGSDILLIALTGYGLDQDRKKAEEAGFDVHFSKPVNLESLSKVIANWKRPKPQDG